ncbi:sulfur carrier protein ThiS [Robbsia sp. KACC 23696]|uniref:sulfur carrier protein ThiS n=1 Tax=Robbsia sp. KACC 23696 TaxID=3149231 RepID=UPI00325B627B
MDILINQRPFAIDDNANVADALQAFGAKPPFAVAVNGQFVARSRYAAQPLSQNDRLDVVQPVTGG